MTAIAASLMTVVYVQGRNYFREGGVSASVGVKLFAFMWAAVACLFLALLIFALGGCIPGEKTQRSRRRKAASYQEKPLVADTESAYVPVTDTVYVAPATDQEHSLYTNDLPRSSYERLAKSEVAPPIDGSHTTGERGYEGTGTGATYVR